MFQSVCFFACLFLCLFLCFFVFFVFFVSCFCVFVWPRLIRFATLLFCFVLECFFFFFSDFIFLLSFCFGLGCLVCFVSFCFQHKTKQTNKQNQTTWAQNKQCLFCFHFVLGLFPIWCVNQFCCLVSVVFVLFLFF